MKVVFGYAIDAITIEQCLKCHEVGLDIYLDEGHVVTVQDTDE